jgi:hypothetical protein
MPSFSCLAVLSVVVLLVLAFTRVLADEPNLVKPNLIKCHDPAMGGNPSAKKVADKKFLMIAGIGSGVGNYLVFFPAAYYFAALTGRVSVFVFNSLCSSFT